MAEQRVGSILCFGEVLLRLITSPGVKLANASSLSLHCGGAEANVGGMLAQLGHPAEMVTILPRSQLGDLCAAELRRTGLGIGKSLRADGRLGLYFMEQDARGAGRITYDRGHSAFAEHADEIDWSSLFANAHWLHLSGINIALGGKAAQAAVTAVETFRAAGATISFDVNHRASLWEGRPNGDFELVRKVAAMADVLFASPPDLSRLVGRDLPNASEEERRRAARAAFDMFETPRTIACTLRWFESQGQYLSARIDTRDGGHETGKAIVTPVIDRIGSGDAFAGGVIDGLLRDLPPEDCARNGLSAAVMKHGISGDRWIGTREDLETFDPFSAGDVRR